MAQSARTIRKISNIPSACRERYLGLDSPVARPLVAMGAQFAGMSELRTGYRIGNPAPARLMLIATVSGQGFFRTPTLDLSLDPQSVLVAPPVSGWTFGVAKEPWRILWCYFVGRGQLADARARGIQLRREWSTEELGRAMAGYLHSRENAERAGLYGQLVASCFHDALEGTGAQSGDTAVDQFERVLSEVRRSPERHWDIGAIAQTLGMSVSTLQRRVKAHYGTTVWQLVLGVRMKVAEQLLKRTDYPLKVIADRVGYADEFVFSTAFKRHYGTPPQKHRNNKQ